MKTYLRELLAAADKTRCWTGIFAGAARCRQPGTWVRPAAAPQHPLAHDNGLLVEARWCDLHKKPGCVRLVVQESTHGRG
jgi:hypothetical protein